MQEIWSMALEDLRATTDQPAFESWLSPIQLVGERNGQMELGVPDPYFLDYIESNYYDVICSSVHRAAQRPMHVRLLVADPSLIAPLASPEIVPQSPAQAALDFGDISYQHASSKPTPHDHLVNDLDFATFVVGQPNQLAHGAAQAVAESDPPTFNPLFLYGGVGIGKTHLLHAIGHEVRARYPHKRILYVAAASFIDDFLNAIRSKDSDDRTRLRDRYRNIDLLLVDDVQFLQGKKKTQEEFFHTFNALHQAGKQIVLASDRFPSELSDFQDRLRSRFAWGLVAEIDAPDRDMRVAILHRKATARGMNLSMDVIHYLADHLRNNVRELEGALNKLALHARISQRKLDLNLAREVMGPVIELPSQRLTIDAIQRATAKHFSLKLTDLKGSKRYKAVVVPRMIAMALARKHTESSYPEIGRMFGGRDHSTVISACKRVKWWLSIDPRVPTDVQAIEELLGR